jgi:malonyl-CoA decarboxylase
MEQNESPKLIDKTLSNLRRAWAGLVGAAKLKGTSNIQPALPEDDLERVRRQIEDCLEGRGGEVSGRARVADLGQTYLILNAQGRKAFLELLAHRYGVDNEALARAVADWSRAYQGLQEGNSDWQLPLHEAETAMRDTLTPPRVRLLAQFNTLPQGVKFLVDMRADLLALFHARDPVMKGFDEDFKRLLASWFDVGFLELRCITWDAPASLLEKLARYEAVHAIKSWNDIKNRLAPDRRCYAFFHPQMPDEPLIYIWVALVRGMADNVQALLDVKAPTDNPAEADAAIFYSISNAQKGLASISFGNSLIKRVVADLAKDFKKIRIYATLSPIPGFCRWLVEQIAEQGDDLLLPGELRSLSTLAPDLTGVKALSSLLEQKSWYKKPPVEEAMRAPLLRLCARYLTQAKRGKYALDRVAHFHLSNGARMERINWLGDTSTKGMRESFGMMINYLYKMAEIESNHEGYRGAGKIKISSSLEALLKI